MYTVFPIQFVKIDNIQSSRTENKMRLSSDKKNKLKNKSECEMRLN